MAIPIKPASTQLHFLLSAIFAETGPITQSIKAENEPTNAIIELKSGMKMETATERHAKTERSITTSRSVKKRGLVVLCCDCASRPKMISRVILTCKGTKIRKDVYLFSNKPQLTGRVDNANFVLDSGHQICTKRRCLYRNLQRHNDQWPYRNFIKENIVSWRCKQVLTDLFQKGSTLFLPHR